MPYLRILSFKARSRLDTLYFRPWNISYNFRLDPETFLTERAKGRHFSNCGLRITCHSRIGKASLVGLLSPPGQELNGARGGDNICFAPVFWPFFFSFLFFFLFMFCLFFTRVAVRWYWYCPPIP